MRNKLYRPEGLPLLSMPVTQADRVNNHARGILDLGRVTGAQLLHAVGYDGSGPLLFCGSQSQAFPLVRQAALSAGKPFLLIGSEHTLRDSCFLSLEPEWTRGSASPSLPTGSGCLMLQSGQASHLELKESLANWIDRYLILLPGCGLQLDGNDLDLLNTIGSYAIISDSIGRSFASSSETGITLGRVYESMDLVVCRTAGGGIRELISVLPTFQQVKTVNSMDYSNYKNGAGTISGIPMRGRGIRLSQARSIETKPVLEEEQITTALHQSRTVVISMAARKTFVADYR